MKQIIFTDKPESIPKNENIIIGAIGNEIKPIDGVKQVPAIKLLKVMKHLEQREGYQVTGDDRYVEMSKRFGYKVQEPKKEERTKKEQNDFENGLLFIASQISQTKEKYSKEYEDKLKSEQERMRLEVEKYQKELEAERMKYDNELKKEREKHETELVRVKSYIKTLINE